MKIKSCSLCEKEIIVAYRVKIKPGKIWIFVCGKCCIISKGGDFYTYGGTWKGKNK